MFVVKLSFLLARYPRRRGAGHPDQGNHRRGRRYPPHPQVAHREEGRGHQVLDISNQSSQKDLGVVY